MICPKRDHVPYLDAITLYFMLYLKKGVGRIAANPLILLVGVEGIEPSTN